MLSTVDAEYAKARVFGIDAQIKELRDQIKRLEKKKAIFKNAAANTGSDEPVED